MQYYRPIQNRTESSNSEVVPNLSALLSEKLVTTVRDRYLEEITQQSAQMTKNVQFGPEMTETISP
jgi:hypothetical protein